MSKKIIKIEQIDKGGENENGVQVDKLWELHFENQINSRKLDYTQVLSYLTKGTSPPKSVYSFKRWETTFISTDRVHYWWCIVYDDKDHILLLPSKFYDLIYEGHRKEEEELHPKKETPIDNPFLFTDRITTPEEKEELKTLRKEIDADEAFKLGLHLHDDEAEYFADDIAESKANDIEEAENE